MAVLSQALTLAIISASQARFPGSINMPKIASAVGKSLPIWLPLPTNVFVQGVSVGVAGAGTVTGKMFVQNGARFCVAGLQQAGVAGVSAQGVGAAVGTGVAAVLNAALEYRGTAPGVGSGFDASKVRAANPATLIPTLTSNMQSVGLNGISAPLVATGLSIGIANLVQTGFGFGGVSGSPSPVPAVSTSISSVF